MMGMPLSYSYSMQGMWGWLAVVLLLSALASYHPGAKCDAPDRARGAGV